MDCENGEVVDPDLVISKLTLEVYGDFGEYGRCNICGKDGIDFFSGLKCAPGKYFCTCGPYFHPYPCNQQAEVGRENISTQFKDFNFCTWDNWIIAPWVCWGFPVVKKTGGIWYSTTSAGWCDSPQANDASCRWRARIEKVVNKSCSDEIIHTAVEQYDAAHDGCFERCPMSPVGRNRNTSNVCWIYCFYATVLGEKALIPGSHASGGMPVSELDLAFERPFLPVSLGGCPAIDPPPQSSLKQPGRWAKQRSEMLKRLYNQANLFNIIT